MGVPFAAVNRTWEGWVLEDDDEAGQSKTWDPVSSRQCRLEMLSVTRPRVAGWGCCVGPAVLGVRPSSFPTWRLSSPSNAYSTWKTWVELRGRFSLYLEQPKWHFLAASPNLKWKWQSWTAFVWPVERSPRCCPPRAPRRDAAAGWLDTAATEADADTAPGVAADAFHALSAASRTASKFDPRLPVIAVTITGWMDRRKILLRMSSVIASPRRCWSSRPNSFGRASLLSVVHQEGVELLLESRLEGAAQGTSDFLVRVVPALML